MAAFAEMAELSSCDKDLWFAIPKYLLSHALHKKFGDFDLEK